MATLNLQVVASTDDCYRYLSGSGGWSLTASLMAGKYDSTFFKYGSGMRFQNVTIPQGSTISTAYLKLTATGSTSGTTCNTRVSAEGVDDAPTFEDDASAFDTRFAGHTTARVDWDNLSAWTNDTEYSSPDIKTVIQEIVNRAGWASGNDIVIFWEDFDNRSTIISGNPRRTAYSYNFSTTKAPKLGITYTTGEAKTSGDSGSGAEAISSREMGTTETGSGVEVSLAAVALLSSDIGGGLDVGGLLQGLFSQDEGGGADGVRILTGKAGYDLKLHPQRGKVNISHKEVNL